MKNPSDDIKKKAERTERLFRENLNYYMDAKGRSQADLAKALGVSTSTASYWLKGQRVPRMNMIGKAAIWLGLEPHELITERKNDAPPLDKDIEKLAYKIQENKDLRELVVIASKSTAASIRLACDILVAVQGDKNGGED